MATPSTRANVILSLIDNASPAMRGLAVKLDRMAVKAQRAGLAMGAGAAVLGAGLYKTIKLAGQLDDNMLKVKARVAGISTAELAALRKEAKLLGRTTSFTTGEVSDLMAKLGQGGASASAIDAMTGSLLDFARAGDISTDQAAEFAMTTARSFHMDTESPEQMAHVVDVLTYAANNSMQSVEDLGEAMSSVAPVAKSLDMSVEDTAGSLALLANMGIKGSKAGRQMKNVLTAMGKKGSEVADELGVSIMDYEGNMKKLPDIMKDFHNVTKDMGNVEAMALFDKAFGRIGLNSAMLMGEGADKAKQFTANMENLSGYAKKAAADMDSGIMGSLRRMWSAIEGVALAIGESLIPVVEAMSSALTWLLNVLTPILENFTWLGGVLAGLFAFLATGAAGLLTFAGVATVVSAALSGMATLISTAVAIVTALFGTVGTALVPIVALSVLLGAAIYVVVEAFWGWDEVIKNVTATLGEFFGAFGLGWEGILNALKSGDFGLAFEIALKTGQLVLFKFLDMVLGKWRGFAKFLLKAFFALSNGLSNVWNGIINAISTGIIKVMGLLRMISKETKDQMLETNAQISADKKEQATDWLKGAYQMIDGEIGKTTAQVEQDLKDLNKQAEDKANEMKDAKVKDANYSKKPWWVRAAEAAKEAAEAAAKEAQAFYDKHFDSVKITETATTGSVGAFSAAALSSNLAKDMKQIAQEQLTVTKETNRILLKNSTKKGVWID